MGRICDQDIYPSFVNIWLHITTYCMFQVLIKPLSPYTSFSYCIVFLISNLKWDERKLWSIVDHATHWMAMFSDVYYMNSAWNKRQWLYLFGGLALPCVFFPTLHNFRIISFIGIVTTSITSAYMTTAAIQHGQVFIFSLCAQIWCWWHPNYSLYINSNLKALMCCG